MSEENKDENVVDLSDYDTEGEAKEKAEDKPDAAEVLDKLKKEYLYLRADFDNYKKSAIKERADLIKFGAEPLVHQLLTLIDTFDHALSLEITPESLDKFREGVQMIRTEFGQVLGRFGVEEVDSEGQQFDPNIHEALSSEPTDQFPPGHVSKVMKSAYKMHGKVIRPAQVVVAKEIEQSNDSEDTSSSEE